jgi:hypothetical protein
MKFPPDDLRDIVLRTEEQRRAMREPFFKETELQARLAENLITSRIDRSMVDRFAAAASALDLKGFGHLDSEIDLVRLQTAQARVEGVLLFMLLLSTPLSA